MVSAPARVRVTIDRLVLDGVAPRDVPLVRAAFERELRALIVTGAERLAGERGAHVRRTRAPYAPPASGTPRAVGRALARAVYAGIEAR